MVSRQANRWRLTHGNPHDSVQIDEDKPKFYRNRSYFHTLQVPQKLAFQNSLFRFPDNIRRGGLF